MAVCLALAAGAFKLQGAARVPVLALLLYAHDIFYSVGEGPVPFTYTSEAFDLSHREIGVSLSVAVSVLCFLHNPP
jgi:hypothetical protein